jgi:uncharacterized membrane protein YeaQ/YmgE (transglycosylase-associated protein family)
MDEGLLLVSLFIGLIAGAICAVIAQNKGRSPGGYFLLGFFLGLIGIIITAVIPSRVSGGLRQLTPAPEQGWWPDPTGRFDYRYYDGRHWTRHVNRTSDGRHFEDPI